MTIWYQRLNINFFVARSFYLLCNPLIGIRLEVEGEEHLLHLLTARGGQSQSAVLVGNHQRSGIASNGIPAVLVVAEPTDLLNSVLDILYLGRIFPRRAAIMAKQELMWSPLLGQYSQSSVLNHSVISPGLDSS